MARWNICRALEAVTILRMRWPDYWTRISEELKLDEAELKQWSKVAASMADSFDIKTGLFEQFHGYFGLEAINLASYAGRSVPMDVVLGRDRIQKSQVIKQADVIALLGLLPNEFSQQTVAENFRFYEPHCAHGSSLSRILHGLVAARLGETEKALNYFLQTAAIDLADTHVAIAGGVHIAALGGIWLVAVFGFAGLALRCGDIALDPKLPADWRSLTFRIQWQKRHLKIVVQQDPHLVEIALEDGEPMSLSVWGKRQEICRDTLLRVFSDRQNEPQIHNH
jgi:trehalose/maltose hydrolase-like predicted phosphorylase